MRPQSIYAKAMPRRGRPFDGQQRSTLRVPITVSYDGIAKALKNAWPSSIEMAGSIVAKPMRVTVNDAVLFPSQHLVALGLDLDVEPPARAFDLPGMAYLTALPVVDDKTRMLQLRNVRLAKSNAIPGIGAGTGQRLRLTALPFIDGFNRSVKVNVAQPLDDVFTATNAMLNQDIGAGLWLRGRFDALHVGSVHPGDKGFKLSVEMVGALFITTGAQQATAETAGLPITTQ